VIHQPAFTATFSRAGVRALDAAAIDEIGIPAIVLMENAAASVEEGALAMLATALVGRLFGTVL
jgi:NAD(P)H-hydrate repair Nnr-like enzyme with NAD(P)H-hydrate epimerase domain